MEFGVDKASATSTLRCWRVKILIINLKEKKKNKGKKAFKKWNKRFGFQILADWFLMPSLHSALSTQKSNLDLAVCRFKIHNLIIFPFQLNGSVKIKDMSIDICLKLCFFFSKWHFMPLLKQIWKKKSFLFDWIYLWQEIL